MRLYSGSSDSFADDVTKGRITGILVDEYSAVFGGRPSEGEKHSWTNSLVRLKDAIQEAGLPGRGVALEYQLPLSSQRLDALLTGTGNGGESRAEIVELKQWDQCDEAFEPNEVVTFVGKRKRSVLHPCVQAAGYEQYLKDMNGAFEGPEAIQLSSSAYLHNFPRAGAANLLAPKFEHILGQHPLFLQDDFDRIVDHFRLKLPKGRGLRVLSRIDAGPIRPSRKLMTHVSEMIRGQPVYTLLGNQQVAFDTVATAASVRGGKVAVVVKGGPGTGKSVIALNLLSKLMKDGVPARYATGSKAFTETLRKVLGPRAGVQFDWTHGYAQVPEDSVPVVIVDEAHRIRKTTRLRWLPKARQSGIPQVQEILKAARTSVFFVDDLQGVRPDDIGTSTYIKDNASLLGIPVREIELEVQFRCKGSGRFVQWVDSVLSLREGFEPRYRVTPEFDFRIVDDPFTLEKLIHQKAAIGKTARIAAGFCWEWSGPRGDGTLVDDVVIGDFARPWNAKPDAGRLAKGIPKASLWGTLPGGLNQVGCVYTAQGFEFDYIGLIIGPDLVVGNNPEKLEGTRQGSADPKLPSDPALASTLVRRAYRVLLSRGMEGCFVYFTNPRTREFFQTHLQ